MTILAPQRLARKQPAFLADWFAQLLQQDNRIVDRGRRPAREMRLADLAERALTEGQTWRGLGIGAGSPVLFSCGTSLDFITHFLALLSIGAVPAPVSHLLPAPACAAVMDLVRPAAILCMSGRRRLFSPAREIGNPFDCGLSLMLDERALPPRPELVGCLIILSSGSTGTPKAVVHSVESALLNARLHATAIEVDLALSIACV